MMCSNVISFLFVVHFILKTFDSTGTCFLSDTSTEGTTSLFCHLRPFMLYSISYSCGPDIEVCCQFDFSSNKCWNWGKYQDAEAITKENIEKK